MMPSYDYPALLDEPGLEIYTVARFPLKLEKMLLPTSHTAIFARRIPKR